MGEEMMSRERELQSFIYYTLSDFIKYYRKLYKLDELVEKKKLITALFKLLEARVLLVMLFAGVLSLRDILEYIPVQANIQVIQVVISLATFIMIMLVVVIELIEYVLAR